MIMNLAPPSRRFHSPSADQFHDRSQEQSKIQNVSNLHRKPGIFFQRGARNLETIDRDYDRQILHSLGGMRNLNCDTRNSLEFLPLHLETFHRSAFRSIRVYGTPRCAGAIMSSVHNRWN